MIIKMNKIIKHLNQVHFWRFKKKIIKLKKQLMYNQKQKMWRQ